MRGMILLVAALTLPPLGAGAARAQDVAAGEELYGSVCRTCHGPTAKGMASFPRLAGHDAEYLAGQLEQYRAGETVGPNSPLMIPHARDLSDEDIADVVAYVASLP